VPTSTIEAIRDRLYTLVEALTPALDSQVKFRRHRAERDGRLEDWAEKHLAACLRRFSSRATGADEMPLVSNTLTETVKTVMELRIAYPQDHRYGAANALDRDDVIEQDWLKINRAVGVYSRANFTTSTDGSYDCTPMGGEKDVERSAGVDYLVVRLTYEFQRSIT
jgi:hypothetical protein